MCDTQQEIFNVECSNVLNSKNWKKENILMIILPWISVSDFLSNL